MHKPNLISEQLMIDFKAKLQLQGKKIENLDHTREYMETTINYFS